MIDTLELPALGSEELEERDSAGEAAPQRLSPWKRRKLEQERRALALEAYQHVLNRIRHLLAYQRSLERDLARSPDNLRLYGTLEGVRRQVAEARATLRANPRALAAADALERESDAA